MMIDDLLVGRVKQITSEWLQKILKMTRSISARCCLVVK